MGLKKRNKVSAEFSMSSLTDIIFLLLIFFMLTSTLVNLPQVDLPESDVKTVAPTSIVVGIDLKGVYTLNGAEVPARSLAGAIGREIRDKKKEDPNGQATVTIVAEKGVPFRKVQDIITISASFPKVNAILATQPKG